MPGNSEKRQKGLLKNLRDFVFGEPAPDDMTLFCLREKYLQSRDVAERVRAHHDQAAIERLSQLMEKARHSKGKHEPLLQVGRDGVYVQTRPFWEEASCGTLAVYDRSRRRLGTVYLGQMPESEQPTMTARLTVRALR